jgi:hypothetical protein
MSLEAVLRTLKYRRGMIAMGENRAATGSDGDRKPHLTIGVIAGMFLTILAIASIGAFGRPPGAGQDLPKASEILERYVKVLGGASAIQKHKSRTRKGVLKAASGNTAAIVEYVGSYKIFTKFTTTKGDFIQAANGNVAWASNPKRGVANPAFHSGILETRRGPQLPAPRCRSFSLI